MLIPQIIGLLLFLSANSSAAVNSRSDWDSLYFRQYGRCLPECLPYSNNETGQFAWDAAYWVRSFCVMADTYHDTLYLSHAERLIRFMLDRRDDRRQQRGELNLAAYPYYSAPPAFLKDRSRAAPGWRVWDGVHHGYVIETLHDGQITNAIMEFVLLVRSRPEFASFRKNADEFMSEVVHTVEIHRECFRLNAAGGIPGSYFYPKPDGSGLFKGALPLNHSLSMGTTLLQLFLITGDSLYFYPSAALWQYWKSDLQPIPSGGFTWHYHPQQPGVSHSANGTEDVNHAHVDVRFLLYAEKAGIVDSTILKGMTQTLLKQILQPDLVMSFTVDGKEPFLKPEFWAIGIDWIELTRFNLKVAAEAHRIYRKYYPRPTWSRPFLGWACLLRWLPIQQGGSAVPFPQKGPNGPK